MAPRGVCAHLPCVAGELSSRCSSSGSERGEWDARRRYRQLLDANARGRLEATGHLSASGRLVDASNDLVLLPTDTYPGEAALPPGVAARLAGESTNLYAKVRPRRPPRSRLVLEAPPALQPIPEAGAPAPPMEERGERLGREVGGRRAGGGGSRGVGAGDGERPLPRLPPVCGRSPPCGCPEDRELAAKVQRQVVRKISTLRRRHLRLRVRPSLITTMTRRNIFSELNHNFPSFLRIKLQ